ncbi:hypothetical protein BC833DRAFT_655265 [Globomyces pollinis-pini]|nr:hypothetical protein BC833DRAFT_655265 [Globomyces pollinis-pini]
MIDFNDNTTNIVYYASLSLLSICIIGCLLLVLRLILNLKKNNRHRYQVFLIGLDISIAGCAIVDIATLIMDSNWLLKWLFNIFDFTAFTLVLLSQLEILRLLEVITNFSEGYLRLIQFLVMSYNIITGGYHLFNGIAFRSLTDDNLFAKWARWGIYSWYGGIGIYVISQSCYTAYKIYKHYYGLKSIDKDAMKRQVIAVVLSITILSFLIIFGMIVLVILVLVLQKIPSKNGQKVSYCVGAFITFLKYLMALAYQSIFNNIIGMCLCRKTIQKPKAVKDLVEGETMKHN